MAEIKKCSLEGIIIMEIEKSSVTESNRPCNEPEVIRGQSNRFPSSTPVMGCSLGPDEHLIMKLVHEEVDEIGDKVKELKEASKLGSAKEDVVKYIYKGLDRMGMVMVDVEEASGDAKEDEGPTSGGCTSYIPQESGWPEEEISLEPPSGQVGGTGSSMEVMVNSEGGG